MILQELGMGKHAVPVPCIIGGHGTLQKYRGTGTRYFAKINTAVPAPVLSNQKYRGTFF